MISVKPPLNLQNQDKWMALANKPQQKRPARPPMAQKQPPQQPQPGPTFSFDKLLDQMDEEKVQREREVSCFV
jgi:hypothetical protein